MRDHIISKILFIIFFCLSSLSFSQSINNGLVAFYPFNGNANDESVNSNNATVYGATLTDDRFGNPNSAYYFNGLTDYIEALDDSSLNPAQISIAAWISTDFTTSHTPDIIRKGSYSSDGNHKYLLRLTSDSKPDFKIRNNGLCTNFSSWESNTASIDIQMNKWQFLVGTFDGSVLKLYINGALYQTVDIPDGSINNTCASGPLKIGNAWSSYPNYFKGKIDDVRIYNRALLDWEVDSLFGNPIFLNTIRGNIYTDGNADCIMQSTENKLSHFMVKASPDNYYGWTDDNGQYWIKVDSGAGSYTVSQQFNPVSAKLLTNQCASSAQTVSLNGAGKDTCCFNFADSVKQCSLLNISVQRPWLRPCFKHRTYVNYANYGFIDAVGTQIKIEYSSNSIPVSSYPIWSSKQGSTLIYNIGTLPAGVSGQIIISDSVACDIALTGLTECTKATISPVSDCTPINPAWDKSSMKVTGACQSGNAHFIIANDGTGDMAGSLQYRVYENDTLIFTGTYQLKSGENFTVDYPAQGQTIRLEADQNSFHPGNSHPRATIENCGVASPEVRNLVTTASQDDLDEEVAITCGVIQNSWDPNLKQALPSGTGAAHNVVPGEEIEYVIHFQNTGTDTAYTVTVVDTLDAGLDVASFTQGASSHPYTLGISGKGQAILTFKFNNINLPDSTTNLLASSGLVSYRMTVPSGATTGTVIKNKAYIYFDYNTPVITNETMHTVGNTVPSDLSKGSAVRVGVTTGLTNKRSGMTVKIYPNPTTGFVTIETPSSGDNMEMRVISVLGVVQKTITMNNTNVNQVNLEGIQSGTYIYEILQDGDRKAGGLLQIK